MATMFDESRTQSASLADDSSTEVVADAAPSDRIGRFVLLEKIGSGGMGELHAAYDARLDRKVAVKLVRSDGGGSQANARLLREAQALAKLSHPNVVTVYEVGVAPGRGVYVAMEYVRGQTLSAWLNAAESGREDESGPEPVALAQLLRLFRDAGRGLDAVHQAGLAHRDFKPDNVIVGEDGRARVIDFGLARNVLTIVDEDEDPSDEDLGLLDRTGPLSDADLDELTPNLEFSTLTRAGAIVGTPRYMATEQWLAQRGDSRSDQFAFCVALYRALYRQWPFPGETRRELVDAVMAGAVRPPPRRADVSDRLQAAIVRGLARHPDDRAPDMGELLAAIDELLEPRARRVSPALLVALALTLAFAAWTWLAGGSSSGSGPGLFARYERELRTEQRREQLGDELAQLEAAGRLAEADALFAAFAEAPQHAHTDALARAWLDQAARLRARAEADGELLALGEAQIASASVGQRREALVELVRALDRSNRFAERGTALAELARVGFDEHDRPGSELWAIAVRDAIHRRDFDAAFERLEQAPDHELARGLEPLLRELDRSAATGHRVAANDMYVGVARIAGFGLTQGEREALLLWSGESAQVLEPSPSLPVLHELEFPGDAPQAGFVPLARGSESAPRYVIGRRPGRVEVYALAREGERLTARSLARTSDGIARWAVADLFDGRGWDGAELWAANTTQRVLQGFRRDGEELVAIELEPSFAAQRSVVGAIAVDDLDGDGGDELILGLGAWWAYDLRVLGPARDPGASGAASRVDGRARFELLARRKLGSADTLAVIPAAEGPGRWIAVSVTETPPNLRVFPPPGTGSEGPGVHLLAWREGQLDLVESFALPNILYMDTGDIDGDGRDELLAQAYEGLAILRAGPQRRYLPLWIDGLKLHAVVDLDGDGDDELLVEDLHADRGALQILGLGSGSLAQLEPEHEYRDPSAQLDPALAEQWRRAEVLHHSGLPNQAKQTFEALARLASPGERAEVLGYAAALAEGELAPSVVAELYERAGDRESLARAVELHEQTHAYAEAARVAGRLAERLDGDADQPRWRSRAAALRELGEPAARLEFEFAEPLDERWRVARPELLKREPAGLRVDAIHGPALLERPIVWAGGALEVELELELDRVEWGSGVLVELVPVDAEGRAAAEPLVQLRFGSWGGGGHYELRITDNCMVQPGGVGGRRELDGALPPEGQTRFALRLGLRADEDQAWIRIESRGDGPPDTKIEGPRNLAGAAEPGRYVLRLAGGDEAWTRASVRLDALRLLGARDDPQARDSSRRERIAAAIVRDESARARALIDDAAPGELDLRDAAWLRGLALARAGDWGAAVPEFERGLAGCDDPAAIERFGYALLLWPDRLGPILRRMCTPEQFLRAAVTVAETALFQHKDLRDLHRTLTTQLIELERYEPGDLELVRATMILLTSRARGWYMQGIPEAAEADLRRVVELAERWREAEADARTEPEQARELRRARALAHVGYAAVLMHRKKPDEAIAALARALAADEAPEIIADVIVARSMFGPLKDSALWAEIEAAQRGLWRREGG